MLPMAKRTKFSQRKHERRKKKTRQGAGKFTKWGHKGGGPSGSTASKKYRKKYRGQGR